METIDLNGFWYHSVIDENDSDALEYVDKLKRIRASLEAGTLYAKFIAGDREGSIAKLKLDSAYGMPDEPKIVRHWSTRGIDHYKIENVHLWLICTWTGRSNKPKLSLPHRDVHLLIDYDGPTIWKKFDAASAKEEILKNPDQRDIDDNILEIGDKVFYINARYGSGMTLDRGVIKEFKVLVDSNSHSIYTIIENDDGVKSELSQPHNMVCKIS